MLPDKNIHHPKLLSSGKGDSGGCELLADEYVVEIRLQTWDCFTSVSVWHTGA